MSIQAVGWVLEHSGTKGAARLVLLSIANHANDQGQAWPSKATIAREANVSEQSVKRALADLVKQGRLKRGVNAAPDERIPVDRRPNLYTMVMAEERGVHPDTPVGDAGGTSEPDRGVHSGPTGGVNLYPQTITEPSRNRHTLDHPDPFDAFWRMYPKRVGKRKAESAFRAAVKRADVETVMDGAGRAAAAWAHAKTEKQFIPHPTTWLNRDGWEDDLPDPKPDQLDGLRRWLASDEEAG